MTFNPKKPERFRSELLDQILLFQEDNNDHQIRGVIFFENILDRECIRKAILLSINSIPILGCRYVEKNIRSYWERSSEVTTDGQAITFMDTNDLGEAINKFLSQKTFESKGPQIIAAVIRNALKDTLCIIMNHLVCDGAGFKEYLYFLSSIYTELIKNPNYSPGYLAHDDRSLGQIYQQLNVINKLRLVLLKDNPVNKNGYHFPLSFEKNTKPLILTHKLPRERFNILKEYGKEHKVTINDIILAAYYRVLYKMMNIPDGESLRIPCTVDLRRYHPNRKRVGFCNLSSLIATDIASGEEKFEETVEKTNHIMNAKKNSFPGLSGFVELSLMYKLLPYAKFKKLIKNKLIYPMITMSNIGMIDSRKLQFHDISISEAFITTALKYPPYFQLAFSSFNNSITFSVSLYGSEHDRELINSFFVLLDKELCSGSKW